MPDPNKNVAPTPLTPLETAAISGVPVVGVALGVEAADAYNYIDAGWIHNVPASDHLSSIGESYAVGAAGSVATEAIVSQLAARGHTRSAEWARRIGNTVTVLGSIACQVAVEGLTHGVGDKWDVVAGAVATVPGIIAGKGYAKMGRNIRQRAGNDNKILPALPDASDINGVQSRVVKN